MAGGPMMNHKDDSSVSKNQKGRLTGSQLRVLGFIASCGSGGCSETKQALATELQISLKMADRAIHRLREEGLIVSLARYEDNGTQLGNTYIASAISKKDADGILLGLDGF